MPWSAQLFIGVPVLDMQNVPNIGVITVATREFQPELLEEREGGWQFEDREANTITGETGGNATLYGFGITSRYAPSILDDGWTHGRPDPFILDLDLMRDVLAEVRVQWPEAQLMMMDYFY
jgi:hypothetical protein